MSVKRVEFPYAPSGNIDSHQRAMIGVGLDENNLTMLHYIKIKSSNSHLLIETSNSDIITN